MAQALSGLLAIDILFDRFSHEQMRRTAQGTSQTLQTLLGYRVVVARPVIG
jgi:hypothetical protein